MCNLITELQYFTTLVRYRLQAKRHGVNTVCSNPGAQPMTTYLEHHVSRVFRMRMVILNGLKPGSLHLSPSVTIWKL